MSRSSAALLSLFVVVGCGRGELEPCDESNPCAKGLWCAAVPSPDSKALCMTQQQADAECAKSDMCKRVGNCGYSDSSALSCLPTKKEHCEQSKRCTRDGDCRFDAKLGCLKP